MADLMLSLKELVVILIIAGAVFALAQPIALRFVSLQDFRRRRNTWLALTAVAFISPNFWIFAAVAIPVLIVVGGKDSCPAALYLLLLHLIPPFSLRVPMIGISYLLDIDNYLLLSFFVLTPVAFRLWSTRARRGRRGTGLIVMDLCLLAYGAITTVLYIHPINPDGTLVPQTATDSLRRGVEFLFENIVPYYVISRSATNRKSTFEMMSMFCLACGVMAAIAMFEAVKHWLLYGDLATRWGHASDISLYVTRNDSLRAMASSGHSLALGYLLVIAFGFWLCLRDYEASSARRTLVTLLFWAGLIATYSRGPWIGAVFVYFVFAMLRPGGASGALKALGVGVMVAVVVSLTPLRAKIVSVMPMFGGKVDYANVVYRQLLMQRAWQIIRDNPWIGNQSALLQMMDLRQGQGIIDVVNAYVQIALSSGIVGLSLILTFIGIGAAKVWSLSRRLRRLDPALSLLGTSLLACILATLLMIENGSLGTGVEKSFYILAGLASAYAYYARREARVRRTAPSLVPQGLLARSMQQRLR